MYLFTSSITGLNPMKGILYYDVSKAGLDMVTKQFALELGPHQIRVNSVNFTVVLTESIEQCYLDFQSTKNVKAITPLGRHCPLKESTKPIMYLLSDHSAMVT